MHYLRSTLRSWLHEISTRINFGPLDWRTTIHWNIVLTIFPHNHICQDCWKNTRSTFVCMVILQSRGQGPDSCWKYGTDLSRSSPSFLDLVPWLWEWPYIQMLVWYFSNNLDVYDYVGKLPKQHFSVWFFTDPGATFYSCWNLMKPGSQIWTYLTVCNCLAGLIL